MPRPSKAKSGGAAEVDQVKTTVLLPGPLLRAAKIQAVNDRTDLRSIVTAALEDYLRAKKGSGR